MSNTLNNNDEILRLYQELVDSKYFGSKSFTPKKSDEILTMLALKRFEAPSFFKDIDAISGEQEFSKKDKFEIIEYFSNKYSHLSKGQLKDLLPNHIYHAKEFFKLHYKAYMDSKDSDPNDFSLTKLDDTTDEYDRIFSYYFKFCSKSYVHDFFKACSYIPLGDHILEEHDSFFLGDNDLIGWHDDENLYFKYVKYMVLSYEALLRVIFLDDNQSSSQPNQGYFLIRLQEEAPICYSSILRAMDDGVVRKLEHGVLDFQTGVGAITYFFKESGFTEWKTIKEYVLTKGQNLSTNMKANSVTNEAVKFVNKYISE